MKKTTKKVTATKAPAKKTVQPKTAQPASAAKPAPRKAKSPASKTVVNKEPPATIIFARIDIGFGNHLYLRGEGPGLSWDRGVAMDCVGNGLWTATIKNAAIPVVFKLLVNDISWTIGADYVAAPGQSLTIDPQF